MFFGAMNVSACIERLMRDISNADHGHSMQQIWGLPPEHECQTIQSHHKLAISRAMLDFAA
jgi:hypothetical protein